MAFENTLSFLFVPADRPERFAKALASGAGAVILDLEDAIGLDAKPAARAALLQGFAAIPNDERPRVLLRINAFATPWFADDLALVCELAAQGLGGVMLAKAESAQQLGAIAQACPGLALIPLVESGTGLDALGSLASAAGVARLCLGHLDLQNDLGIDCSEDESEIAPARWALVRASRRAGLPAPIDGVTADVRNAARAQRDAARAMRCGFGAKLCIHPAQVAAVHAAFLPSAEQQQWAQRVLDAAAQSRGGACSVDGKMVDAPVITSARRILARSGLA